MLSISSAEGQKNMKKKHFVLKEPFKENIQKKCFAWVSHDASC